MKLIGKDITAVDRWRDVGDSYAQNITGAYHRQRLAVIKSLLADVQGKTVVDFGCGEGVLSDWLLRDANANHVTGIDIDQQLYMWALMRGIDVAYPGRIKFIHGGVEKLAGIDRCDVLVAANVLAYMTREEEDTFYRETARLGASLVVTHSNSLFDMFTLNAYTVAFYRENFGVDVGSLLSFPIRPERNSFNIRENPLAYGEKLAKYGFKIERLEYMNYHPTPPLLTSDDPDDMYRERPNTDAVPEWRRMFQCSMFACKAKRSE